MKKMTGIAKIGGLLLLIAGALLAGACSSGEDGNNTPPPPVNPVNKDKTDLDAKIAEAEDALDKVKVSADGSNVDETGKWLTQTERNALNNALIAAKAVSNNDEATQTEVDMALSTLTTALGKLKPGTKPPSVNKTALGVKIADAQAALDAVTVSIDGSDVVTTNYWVTQPEYDDLNTPLTTAKTVSGNAAATQTEVDDALTALTTALAAFSPKAGLKPFVNKSGLNVKITEAQTALNGVTVSADGSDVVTTNHWVTQPEYDDLNSVLNAAKTVFNNDEATQTEVDDALTALTTALVAFSPKAGTVNKTALNQKITEAQTALNAVTINANGLDVDPGDKWVTQAEYNALNTPLTAAKNVSSNNAATQTQVNNALTNLTTALASFSPKAGLKVLSDSPNPSFSNVTVHDPSIFLVNDNGTGTGTGSRFRIIGSFLASARTSDLMSWTLEQSGGNANNYPDSLKYKPKDNTANTSVQTVAQQQADVLRPTTNDGLNFFASDIHKMPNGKFYHYYSMTSTWKCSAIGVAIADTVDGNYITQGLFVRSAEANNNRTPIGNVTWNSNSHPNCIDPQAFFDKTGANFYVVYGSWSGGIFIYEIDTATGLPKTNSSMNNESNGYGRKLIANQHSAIEAPYILYSPDTDYYYLFVSFGNLAADYGNSNQGGYNMRIFRSRNAYGPYEDATHPITSSAQNPLAATNLNPSPTSSMYFNNYGVKIMGSYQFDDVAGENSKNNNIGRNGFLRPGHNSAYYDSATGKYFLIHHTRFVGQNEGHQVRAREMFVTEDGWLAAAPFRYDAGTIRTFNIKQLSTNWKILSHERDNDITISGTNKVSDVVHTSQNYVFNENGTITGAGTGTWVLGADKKTAHITLGGKLYKGVFLRCYDEYHAVWVYAFTAISSDGLALWGATRGVSTNLNVN